MTTGRNAPCPCGSGKKYKQCCGAGKQRWAAPGPARADAPGGAAAQAAQVFRLASQYFNMGRLADAAMLCQQLLLLQPRSGDALNLSGLVAYQSGQHERALGLLKQAIKVAPGNSFIHTNLGNVLQDMKRFDEAEQQFKHAIELRPDVAEFSYNLGNTRQKKGAMAAAVESYRRALALKPDYIKAINNLGLCLRSMGQADEAVAQFKRAMELAPNDAEAWFNLGNLQRDQGRIEEAIGYLKRALSLAPDHAMAHFILAVCLLGNSDLVPGWEEYAWRFDLRESTGSLEKRPFPQAEWRGEDLAGKTLLVWREQGVGDELMFAGVLADAIRAAQHVIVECEPRLTSLLARSFPAARFVPRADLPHPELLAKNIDYQTPLASLPRWFRRTLDDFPRHDGYLVPDPGRVAHWKAWLAGLGRGPKVGIAWRSMLRGGYRELHYTELEQWGGILRVPGAVFVNLQYGECGEELAAAREQFAVNIHEPDALDLKDDLDQVAALTQALDLVITAGTTVCAMAGALGKETWMYSVRGVWDRLGARNYPWFPSVRIYEKQGGESWETLLDRMGNDLSASVAGRENNEC